MEIIEREIELTKIIDACDTDMRILESVERGGGPVRRADKDRVAARREKANTEREWLYGAIARHSTKQ